MVEARQKRSLIIWRNRRPCEEFVRGVVVVHAGVGRTLRTHCVAIRRSDVLGCSGEFIAGDRVYVVMRTRDGSQFVMATGTASFDAAAWHPPMDRTRPQDDGTSAIGGNAVVIREEDMVLQWATGS